MRFFAAFALLVANFSVWSQPVYRRGGFQFAFTSDSVLTHDYFYTVPDSTHKFALRLNGIMQVAGVKPGYGTLNAAAQLSAFPTLGFKSGNWQGEVYVGLSYENRPEDLPLSYGLGQKPVTPFQDSRKYLTPGGVLKYTPSQHFSFAAGYDKNFIGEGYYSLMLSDNAANSPFLKADVSFWKLHYSVLYSALNNRQSFQTPGQFQTNKFTTTHVIDIRPAKWLQLQLFETVIWQDRDSVNRRGFDPSYLNPVIFYRPVEFNLGSADNAMLGGAINLKFARNFTMYSQILIDEFKLGEFIDSSGWWGNKFGLQAGAKWFDAFGVKNLNMLGEINLVRPYTYSHITNNANYGHRYSSMAHPWGANFYQAVFVGQYTKDIHRIVLQAEIGRKGFDTSDTASYGGNIFLPYTLLISKYNNTIAQGEGVNILNLSLLYAYKILPAYGLEFFVSGGYRKFGTDSFTNVNLGIRTGFFNSYTNY